MELLDGVDSDDEEDFQPKRRRSRQAARAALEVADVDEEEVTPVQRTATKRKRIRRQIEVEDDPEVVEAHVKEKKTSPRKAAGDGSVGFGGATEVQGAAAEPAAKKRKWVPRLDAPPNRGNKDLPIGARNCLTGKVFVITGILDSLLREECADLCKEYGARVVGSVSGKVTHGIVGTDPGDSKMKKLKANRCPIISEDDLFAMISKTLPPSKEKKDIEMEDDEDDVIEVEKAPVGKRRKASTAARSPKTSKEAPPTGGRTNGEQLVNQLWVDKYKPSSSSDLVANAKAIRDLRAWLESWKGKFLYGDGHKWKPRERGENGYAAVLLAGPPGIGKTTAAHIVCKELGFEPHEYNASDVRNKGGVHMLAETVMVANTMFKYFAIAPKKGEKLSKGKSGRSTSFPEGQVLIMDEVDGMSGGDRGGSQELIKVIKTSKVPIICIANDDSSPNMRSLSNNCFKLRFRRPMVSQVTKRLMEIARREGFRQLQDQTVARLAEGCNGDIRQMINLLQTWRTSSTSLSFGQVKERLAVEGKTVIQKSIFELAKGFFTPGIDGSQNSLFSRTDNYFADSDLIPLFIQENYVNTGAADSSLEKLALAAESISEGDLCNSLVRREQRWELMPAAAIMSAIRPGSIMAGGLRQQPQFPSFLGNMSKGNKWKRIVQGLEMKVKAAPTTSASVRAFRLDYIPALTTCLATPLIRDGAGGIDEVVERLDSYCLERDPDWLEILDAGVYGKGRSPMESIPGSVKTGFTRAYNSREHRRSTVTGMRVGVKQAVDANMTRKRVDEGDVAVVDEDPVDQESPNNDDDDDDPEQVAAQFGVKRKKKGGRNSAKKATGGRGRGRGRGRGGGRGRGRGRK